jgi:hypothetical protein
MLYWKDAEALINEVERLRYRPSSYERDLISRLRAMTPKVLTYQDEKSMILLYRRAAGGETYQRVRR